MNNSAALYVRRILIINGVQSYDFGSQTDGNGIIDGTFLSLLLVSKIKMIGMLLNVVHVKSIKTSNKGVWRAS